MLLRSTSGTSRTVMTSLLCLGLSVLASEKPSVPHVDSLAMAERQPHEGAKATVWYDDFKGLCAAFLALWRAWLHPVRNLLRELVILAESGSRFAETGHGQVA